MRCPKCGAFMEEGKDICFMCGVNTKTYVPTNNNNNMGFNNQMNQMNNNSTFGSGANFNNNSAFGSGAGFNPNPNYNQMREQYNNSKKDYRNVELKPVKNGEKDIFDFFSENKKIINIVLVVALVVILVLVGRAYYNSRTKEVELTPVLKNLYFEVDDTLTAVSDSSGSHVYAKSGDKGTACSITITYGASTSGDHVTELFTSVKNNLEPELNADGSVVNALDVYTPQESSLTLNDATWHYLNIFYKETKDSEPTQLRYKYLTSVYNGFYYDIALVNNSNDAACKASLDNFARSLKFMDVEEES